MELNVDEPFEAKFSIDYDEVNRIEEPFSFLNSFHFKFIIYYLGKSKKTCPEQQ